MKVIILSANTLYSVFCFFKALLLKQVWSGMVGKGLKSTLPYIKDGPGCACMNNHMNTMKERREQRRKKNHTL